MPSVTGSWGLCGYSSKSQTDPGTLSDVGDKKIMEWGEKMRGSGRGREGGGEALGIMTEEDQRLDDWVAQSVEPLTLEFSAGHDVRS